MGCHANFDLKPGMGNAQKDQTALRFILAQEGWMQPGEREAGELHNRLWGKGPEKVMPADGRELLANELATGRC